MVGTRGYTYDTNEYHPEPRVASIVSSHNAPEWVLNLKETGVVLLVDYSKMDSNTVTETKINAERFLHDGGWDSTKRYFLVAANARDTISVIDTVERKLVKNIKTGSKPHRLSRPLGVSGRLADGPPSPAPPLLPRERERRSQWVFIYAGRYKFELDRL